MAKTLTHSDRQAAVAAFVFMYASCSVMAREQLRLVFEQLLAATHTTWQSGSLGVDKTNNDVGRRRTTAYVLTTLDQEWTDWIVIHNCWRQLRGRLMGAVRQRCAPYVRQWQTICQEPELAPQLSVTNRPDYAVDVRDVGRQWLSLREAATLLQMRPQQLRWHVTNKGKFVKMFERVVAASSSRSYRRGPETVTAYATIQHRSTMTDAAQAAFTKVMKD